mmetsp:Transcript_71446/g.198330  ORF Transcript_71446/g.198330 Transcript_71446/m.198330 type:complete len:210 (-) Transcript_71446:9-638(-)
MATDTAAGFHDLKLTLGIGRHEQVTELLVVNFEVRRLDGKVAVHWRAEFLDERGRCSWHEALALLGSQIAFHRVRLSGAGLPIGEGCCIVAREDFADEGPQGCSEDFSLGAERREDLVEIERGTLLPCGPAHVPNDGHLFTLRRGGDCGHDACALLLLIHGPEAANHAYVRGLLVGPRHVMSAAGTPATTVHRAVTRAIQLKRPRWCGR